MEIRLKNLMEKLKRCYINNIYNKFNILLDDYFKKIKKIGQK